METIENVREVLSNLKHPVGPNVGKFLEIEADAGRNATELTHDETEKFRQYFSEYLKFKSVPDVNHLIELLEELVSMQYGDLALKINSMNSDLMASHEPRGLMALGNAAMLDGDLELAKIHLKMAHDLAPEEIAPYINLSNIYFHEQQDALAEEWALAGLSEEKNNRRLWEILGLVYQVKYTDAAGEELKLLANEQDSWAGVSLAALLTDADDTLLRSQWLEEIYAQGERDPEFLIEYTAVLGTAGQFQKVPLVVLQAERLSTEPLPWQLFVHAAQALLAAEKLRDARVFCDKTLAIKDLNPSVKTHILGLIEEIDLSEEKNKKLNI